jgi:excisionase family DNA binding protein
MENLVFSPIKIEELIERIARKVVEIQSSIIHGTQESPEEILNLDKACSFLNLSRAAIYTMTCRKSIPYIKRGKRLYFKRSDLIEWLNGGRKKTMQEIHEEVEKSLSKRKSNSNV